MENCTYLLITHSSYSDILDIYLRQSSLYFNVPITIAIDDITLLEKYKSIVTIQDCIQYNNDDLYGQRMKSILEHIHTKYVLVNHDSNILVEAVHLESLIYCLSFMEENQVDQIRLSDAGILEPKRNTKLLHKNRGNYYMSALTAIWNRESLHKMYSQFHDHSMRCIECEPIQAYVAKLKNYYVSSEDDIYQMPQMHSISKQFPFVHVTHLGKWTTHAPANNMYIQELAKKYGIHLDIRGRM
jgi:hypothetical protein